MMRSSSWLTVFAMVFIRTVAMIAVHPAQAQTYAVLYNFTGEQSDGGEPLGGLTTPGSMSAMACYQQKAYFGKPY